ncbi:MAG: Gfo/Idh/MocA family oxidoreductase, partial [Victivallales bacterium]|nr:Gfo/Idh/MocA family oxidoreductase [Victivallales bacterium]
MGNKVNIGVIGAGNIGTRHLNSYKEVADANIIEICDILPERLAEKAAQFNVPKTCLDYHEMLANPEIDAVDICLPNYLHAPVAIDAFAAGKHVMLEKPMALNAQLGMDICAARDKAGKLLQMGMVRRQENLAQLVREEISQGRLGEIYQIDIRQIRRRGIPGMGGWFTTKEQSGGGALIDIAVHSFDLALWATNYWNPTRVSARTYSKFGAPMRDYKYVSMWAGPPNYNGTFDVDDFTSGFVRFENYATMSFEVAWAANAEPSNTIDFLGTKGGIHLGQTDSDLVIRTEQNGRLVDVKPLLP